MIFRRDGCMDVRGINWRPHFRSDLNIGMMNGCRMGTYTYEKHAEGFAPLPTTALVQFLMSAEGYNVVLVT